MRSSSAPRNKRPTTASRLKTETVLYKGRLGRCRSAPFLRRVLPSLVVSGMRQLQLLCPFKTLQISASPKVLICESGQADASSRRRTSSYASCFGSSNYNLALACNCRHLAPRFICLSTITIKCRSRRKPQSHQLQLPTLSQERRECKSGTRKLASPRFLRCQLEKF